MVTSNVLLAGRPYLIRLHSRVYLTSSFYCLLLSTAYSSPIEKREQNCSNTGRMRKQLRPLELGRVVSEFGLGSLFRQNILGIVTNGQQCYVWCDDWIRIP